jgi:hypothetical protein
MKTRSIGIAVVIVVSQAIGNLEAQDGVRRTAWGDPDFEGIWTNATLTPLQRPPELAGKAFFTPEEAAQFQRARIQQTNADRPLPSHRKRKAK